MQATLTEAAAGPRSDEILTESALDFVATLHREFEPRRRALLAARVERQRALDEGADLGFLEETRAIREDPAWRVAPPAADIADRRVEITGPTERKMTINALNSGAKVWLADFEDANTPLWPNVVQGQLNLLDAVRGTIEFAAPDGRSYALHDGPLPAILVRPRGWHLDERHIAVDGEPVAGALVDFGLYLFHCARLQLERGSGPYFYLPKLQGHLEARLWNDVFVRAQEILGIPRGTIRATVLIETFPAAFEMEEILYELREHSAGLNAGRWDYMFSIIKCFRRRGRAYVLPDRNSVTMTVPFMRAYTELLVHTCHKRGAHAIGGMAAFIPNRRDPQANAVAFEKVHADKRREAHDGFDGSWVAHPDLVPLCREEFDAVLGDRPNQIDRVREDVHVDAAQLADIASTPGECTEAGLRNAVSVAIQYIAAWLGGLGAVAIFSLMEDAATAEISRSQVWQWLHNDVTLSDGERVTRELVERVVAEEVDALTSTVDDEDVLARIEEARAIFLDLALADELTEFLTIPAYARIA